MCFQIQTIKRFGSRFKLEKNNDKEFKLLNLEGKGWILYSVAYLIFIFSVLISEEGLLEKSWVKLYCI